MLKYYYNLGIPDVPWEENGNYFPRFDDQHWYNMEQFNYFADIFLIKWKSLSENIRDMVECIFEKNDETSSKLLTLLSDDRYSIAKDFRDDITHNDPPNSIGYPSFEFTYDNNNSIIGFGCFAPTYKPSGEVMKVINEILRHLSETLKLITEEINIKYPNGIVF
jgi:hypothetical protein